MGSLNPYTHQLNSITAGISSLSKICLVEQMIDINEDARPPTLTDTIDFNFVGLRIETGEVDVAGNYSNMSSDIGPYAHTTDCWYRRCIDAATSRSPLQ